MTDSNPQMEPPVDGGMRPAALWSRRRGLAVSLACLAIAAAVTGGAIAHFALSASGSSTRASALAPSSSSAQPSFSSSSTSIATVAARVDQGLVDINTKVANGAAAGTGMVVTSSGEAVTNNHVIDGATSITATVVATGKTYKARVVGYDQTKDVAVIQLVGASNLGTVTLGDSSGVRVGQSVITIGNAGGTGGTPSASGATVTALNRSITASDQSSGSSEELTGLIQLNGSLQPGDSGGPLVNGAGQVVGMDTAASSAFSFNGSATAAFAIPVNTVLSIARAIESGSSSSTIHIGATAQIGVVVGSAGNYGYGPYGYSYNEGAPTRGAFVAGVAAGTPAANAGIVAGDTITSFGGHTVSSAKSLTALKIRYSPGQRVRIGWADTSGASHTATITLATGAAG